MFTFLCLWFDCFGLDSGENGAEVQGEGKSLCVCVTVSTSLCKCQAYFSSVLSIVVEMLGLWWTGANSKLMETMISTGR